MDEATSPEFEAECDQFGRLLQAYEVALRDGDPGAREIFRSMKATWETIVLLAPSTGPKANPSPEMYVILAFSHAVGLGRPAEAEYLYGLLSHRERRTLDDLEVQEPGKFKIWLLPDAHRARGEHGP
jgi:hypothetical protein